MHHTQALILRKDEWNEADWLITALTEDFGRIRLLAQGSRKHGAKLQGHLEPGSLVGLSFVVGKHGYRVTTAQLVEFFPAIRTSLSKSRLLFTVLSTLDGHLLESREEARDIFALAATLLTALVSASNVGIVRRLEAWFYVKFLAFLGILPHRSSQEASGYQSLIELGDRAVSEVSALPLSEKALERELAWMVMHLEKMTLVAPASLRH